MPVQHLGKNLLKATRAEHDLKGAIIVSKNIPVLFHKTLWRLWFLPLGPQANNSIQSTSASLFSHFTAYRRGQPETVPPLHSQASAGLSRWQNRRFLCLCLFLSPAVTLRRVAIVSSQSARGQAALPLGRPGSLWTLQARQREGSGESAGGTAPNKAGYT